MGELTRPNDISETDYRAIEEAVMETARGRWFLTEYARRNRVSETSTVLEAINSLKSFITSQHEPADMLQLRLDIVDMADKIGQIKRDIANTGDENGNMETAQDELNVVVDETEKATCDILTAAEQVQEIAWEVCEAGYEEDKGEKLDMLATEIYMACSFQDVTGQRLRKVVQLISVIEERINSMVSLWDQEELKKYRETKPTTATGETLTDGPAMPNQAKGQDEIDAVLNQTQADDTLLTAEAGQIEWSSEDSDNELDSGHFIIDDSFEIEAHNDYEAFVSDTEDEISFQTPPSNEVMEDDLDDEIEPLPQRMALFS